MNKTYFLIFFYHRLINDLDCISLLKFKVVCIFSRKKKTFYKIYQKKNLEDLTTNISYFYKERLYTVVENSIKPLMVFLGEEDLTNAF